MVCIKDKRDCCGCSACVQRCPVNCIDFTEDKEGFLYPNIDKERCIDCSLCEKVCPVINQKKTLSALNVYAAINNDEEIRFKSSSGGLFYLLAEHFIKNKGYVCGAVFDKNGEVKHTITNDLTGLRNMQSSKYMQSRNDNSYSECERLLKEGSPVLFSGVPCQIAGLKNFLRKDYVSLLCVDILCHGSPSPKVWRIYLNELIDRHKHSGKQYPYDLSTLNILFRDKSPGWRNYNVTIKAENNDVLLTENHCKNAYMKAFLNDLILRPSCHKCPARLGSSGSDITLGDFWSINKVNPELDDNKGLSMVIINSSKGLDFLNNFSLNLYETDLNAASPCHGGSGQDQYYDIKRKLFFENIDNCDSITDLMNSFTRKSILFRLKHKIKNLIGI